MVDGRLHSSDEQPVLRALYDGVVMTEKTLIKTFEVLLMSTQKTRITTFEVLLMSTQKTLIKTFERR